MADTLGGLVDKLSITNLKLWFIQDKVHGAAKSGQGLDADTVAKLHALNLQRNGLMTEIDACMSEAIRTGEVEVDPRVKIT